MKRTPTSKNLTVLWVMTLVILFVESELFAAELLITRSKYMPRSTSGTQSSLTDSIVTLVSSDANYQRNGADNAWFNYRYRGQASARGTDTEAGADGYLNFSFNLPPAIWQIEADIDYVGVVAVNSSSAAAAFSKLILSSTGSATGLSGSANGMICTTDGGRPFSQTIQTTTLTTETGEGDIRLSFGYGVQCTTSSAAGYASLGLTSPLSPFLLDDTWYDENDGLFITITFTPSLNLSGQTINWDLAMVPGETLSGYGTINGDITGAGTIHPSGAGLVIGDGGSTTGFSFSGNVEVTEGDLEIRDSDMAELLSGSALTIDSDHVLTIGRLQSADPILLNSGVLRFAGQMGTGAIQNSLGTLAAQASPQNVEIHAPYTQQAHGTLLVKVGAPGQSDCFSFHDSVTLAGSLRIESLAGFVPNAETVFHILKFYAGRTGAFYEIVLPSLNPDYTWDISRLYTDGEIRITRYGGGDGSAEDPYQIWTPEQMNTIGLNPSDWASHFKLMADIDMSGYTYTRAVIAPDEYHDEWDIDFQGTRFSGSFDGNGHCIYNLTITGEFEDYIGLFGLVSYPAQIKNLGMENVNITGYDGINIGGLIGKNESGSVTSCYATGSVSGTEIIGGLVGRNSGTLMSCYAVAFVNGTGAIGGLAGGNNGTLIACYAASSISYSEYYSIGGLVGFDELGLCTACFWDIQTSGQAGSGGGKGLTTAQMKMLSIYQNAGWANKGWVMNNGGDYPRLNWENTGGVPIPLPQAVPLDGSGTGDDPYLISTRQEFASLSWYSAVLDKYLKLAASLDVSDLALYPIGDLGSFTGVFDGSGYTISNAKIHQVGNDFVGLFGRVGPGGQIRNLSVNNVNLTGRDYVGGLVGLNSGSLTDCHTSGTAFGERIFAGGLVGLNHSGTLTACHAANGVHGWAFVGGLAGKDDSGTITGCYATGLVSGTSLIGGLLGVTDHSDIANCYATGSISGQDDIGGLIGWNAEGKVVHCYSTGKPTGNSGVGGLCGVNVAGNYEDMGNFWDIETSAISVSAMGMGKTTAQMQTLANFTDAGWDFSDSDGDPADWYMPVNSYPHLFWETGGTAPELVGWWTFDEGSGTTAYDSSGYNRHGTCVGDPAWVAGRVGGGISFDGMDDYVEAPLTEDLLQWTIGAWVKSPAAPSAEWPSGPVHREKNFQINWNHSQPEFRGAAAICIAGIWYPASFGMLQADTWYHLAATYDGQTLKAYRDGQLITSNEEPSGSPDPDTNSLKFGCHAAAPQFFAGTIDEVRLYNRALTDMEVGQLVPYCGGTGTQEDPYRISTVADWQELTNTPSDWDKHFILLNDIDFGGAILTPVAPDNEPKTFGFQGILFTGIFEGNGHSLRNAAIDLSYVEYVGLFGSVGSGGQIHNLGVMNISMKGGNYVGGLAGENSGTIISCYATGFVNGGFYVGGLVGYNTGMINTCYACSSLRGNSDVGGLVGWNFFGTITSCYASGSVDGIVPSSSYLGGLIGENDAGEISYCVATGSVDGVVPYSSYLGGLIGENNAGEISYCYATGSVRGYSEVGGLVGAAHGSSIIYCCYAVGAVHGIHAQGGLAGYVEYSYQHLSNFWDTQTNGQAIGVGNGASEGIMGATTSQMQTLTTFTDAGWDFTDSDGDPGDWFMPYYDYPRLSWESPHTGGSGSAENPYLIWTAHQMNAIGANSSDWNKHFKLMADIDMSATTGTQYHIIGNATTPFTGSFDGSNHVVKNLTYTTSESVDSAGLFGSISNAAIRNLGVENATILSGGNYVGGLVGVNWYGTISSCYATGSIHGTKFVGGLVGMNYYGTINKCYMTGSITGTDDYIGGLVGDNNNSVISDCYATALVRGAGMYSNYVGGLVGDNFQSVLTLCHATGSVCGTGMYSSIIGGLAGSNGGQILSCYATGSVCGYESIGGLAGTSGFTCIIKNCYATGSVNGQYIIGGLVGNNSGTLANCYVTGSVTGIEYFGGLAGMNYNGTISNSFWDTQTSGQVTSDGGTGKTTSEMQTLSTFTSAGWDFTNETANGNSNIWRMCENNVDYPQLSWESDTGDFTCPYGITTEDLEYYVGQWLMMDCTSANNYCGGTDLDYSGAVDLADWALFAAQWLTEGDMEPIDMVYIPGGDIRDGR